MKLHALWISDDGTPAPDEHLPNWQEVNPTAEIKLWGEAEALAILVKNHPEMETVYKSSKWMVARIGILRFAIIEAEGGIYMDLDVQCHTPFPLEWDKWESGPELLGQKGITGNDPICIDYIFGAKAGHPIWSKLFELSSKKKIHNESRAAVVWGIYAIGNAAGAMALKFKNINFHAFIYHRNDHSWHDR